MAGLNQVWYFVPVGSANTLKTERICAYPLYFSVLCPKIIEGKLFIRDDEYLSEVTALRALLNSLAAQVVCHRGDHDKRDVGKFKFHR